MLEIPSKTEPARKTYASLKLKAQTEIYKYIERYKVF